MKGYTEGRRPMTLADADTLLRQARAQLEWALSCPDGRVWVEPVRGRIASLLRVRARLLGAA